MIAILHSYRLLLYALNVEVIMDKIDDILKKVEQKVISGDLESVSSIVQGELLETEFGKDLLALMMKSNPNSKKGQIRLIIKLIQLGRKYG